MLGLHAHRVPPTKVPQRARLLQALDQGEDLRVSRVTPQCVCAHANACVCEGACVCACVRASTPTMHARAH